MEKQNNAFKNKMKQSRWVKYRDVIIVWCMMLPGVVYLLINNYLPMYGITVAFREPDFSNFLGSDFIGFEHFTFIFESPDIWNYIRNTVVYNLLFMVLNIVIPITLAILFTYITGKTSKKIYQTCILLPYLMSWVIVSYIAEAFLNAESGMINGIIRQLGGTEIKFYEEEKWWPWFLTFFNTWKGVGYSFLFYYSSILAINPSYYEAAKLDGANFWQQVWHITLPGVKTTIITMFILSISKVFYSDFGLFYLVTKQGGNGALYDTVLTLDSYIYMLVKDPSIGGDYYGSSALGVLQAGCGFVLVVIANAILRKVDPESSLF